jgi:hypothetical protein
VVGCVHAKPESSRVSRPECEPQRIRVQAQPAPEGLTPPFALHVVMPPVPIPTALHGATAVVNFVVDDAGKPVKGSIHITGLADSSYVRRFVTLMESTEFTPAQFQGCPVPGSARMTYQLK